jgi:hypothetical protein
MAIIYTNPYEGPYLAAKQELEQKRRELADLQQRITWLENSIAALAPLAGVPLSVSKPNGTGTLGDLVCAVLSANPDRRMTLSDIRKVIDAMGIKFTKPENSSAAINITLRRLAAKNGSAVKIEFGSEVDPKGGPPIVHGPMRFWWDSSVPKPSPNIPFPSEM